VSDCTFARETGEVEVAKTGKPDLQRRPAGADGNPVLPRPGRGSVETLHHPPNPARGRHGEEKVRTPNPGAAGGRESGGGCESVGRGFESLCGLQRHRHRRLRRNHHRHHRLHRHHRHCFRARVVKTLDSGFRRNGGMGLETATVTIDFTVTTAEASIFCFD